jgi:hypothetical protein
MLEQKSYLNLLENSFPGISDNIVRYENLGFSWKFSKPFLKEEKGEVISNVGLLEFSMLIESQWYKTGALHVICTQQAHRGQGFASNLIMEALDWAEQSCDFVILFTEIPKFYEKFSFRFLQEHRFHLPCKHIHGSELLRPIIAPEDNILFRRCFEERDPLSNLVWLKDNGAIASFNSIFATYPTYWSLYYSPAIDGFISYFLEGKTLHLLDVIAKEIPSLDTILDHFPVPIDEIYFYFSPDRFTDKAIPMPYIYDKGHLMVRGAWPTTQPFMISPLSRC